MEKNLEKTEVTEQTLQELENDSAIPAEIKEELAKRVQKVVNNISLVEKAVSDAIDEAVASSETPITITEVYSAILNATKKLNSREIMQLINNV